jgi:hypothetical protein
VGLEGGSEKGASQSAFAFSQVEKPSDRRGSAKGILFLDKAADPLPSLPLTTRTPRASDDKVVSVLGRD